MRQWRNNVKTCKGCRGIQKFDLKAIEKICDTEIKDVTKEELTKHLQNINEEIGDISEMLLHLEIVKDTLTTALSIKKDYEE
jgi:hypothetical protein